MAQVFPARSARAGGWLPCEAGRIPSLPGRPGVGSVLGTGVGFWEHECSANGPRHEQRPVPTSQWRRRREGHGKPPRAQVRGRRVSGLDRVCTFLMLHLPGVIKGKHGRRRGLEGTRRLGPSANSRGSSERGRRAEPDRGLAWTPEPAEFGQGQAVLGLSPASHSCLTSLRCARAAPGRAAIQRAGLAPDPPAPRPLRCLESTCPA